ATAAARASVPLAVSSLAAGAVLVLAVAHHRRSDRAHALAIAAALVAVADLALVHGSLNPTAPRALLDTPPPVAAAVEGPGPTRGPVFHYPFPLLGQTYRRQEARGRGPAPP